MDANKNKKGKSTQEQTLNNLKFSNNDKFKYLQLEDNALEYDYEEDEKAKRDKEMQLYEPPKFKVLGYQKQNNGLKYLPILKMTDMYNTTNPKVRRLINRVFDRHIYGRSEPQKTHENGVMLSKLTSNAQ